MAVVNCEAFHDLPRLELPRLELHTISVPSSQLLDVAASLLNAMRTATGIFTGLATGTV
jgi:hypothetical protein